MSKKLIAVASAAALALTALVGIAPASATAPTVVFDTSNVAVTSTTPGTASVPMLQNVPDTNTLDGHDSADIEFSNIAAGDTMTITTSGKVRLVAAMTVGSADVDVTKLGTQSYTNTFTSAPASPGAGQFTIFVSVTDTTATEIKWSVARTGSTTSGSLWIKGVAGQAYKVTDIVAPSALASAASTEVRFKVTDVFGNQLETTPITAAVTGAANPINAVWDSANKWHDATITSNTNRVFILTIDGNGSIDNPADVAGFADESISSLVVVNSAASLPTAVNAQVAALTAQLAASRPIATSVTKKKYNTLARKWNAAFPSQKVALKK
jgi:hypothetical protein